MVIDSSTAAATAVSDPPIDLEYSAPEGAIETSYLHIDSDVYGTFREVRVRFIQRFRGILSIDIAQLIQNSASWSGRQVIPEYGPFTGSQRFEGHHCWF